jgi:hypothetical protein
MRTSFIKILTKKIGPPLYNGNKSLLDLQITLSNSVKKFDGYHDSNFYLAGHNEKSIICISTWKTVYDWKIWHISKTRCGIINDFKDNKNDFTETVDILYKKINRDDPFLL